MPFNWLKAQTNKLQEEVKKFRNETFLQGVTAACSLVAAADGSIDSSEKQKMMRFIQSNDALKVFDTNKVIESFKKWTDQMEFDMDSGKANAFSANNTAGKDQAQARTVMRVAIAIADADGNTDASEMKVLREICHELGLEPAQFELSQSPPPPPTATQS
jgi:tellurite resistance protein TerB